MMRATGFFLLLTALVFPALAETVAVPWTAYFGAHYESAPWAASIRDPGGPGRFGYWPASTRMGARMSLADSGQLDEIKRHAQRGHVVLNVGGMGSGRDESSVAGFLDEVRGDAGVTWKRELASRVRKVATVPGAVDRVYWQFGNEINGPRFVDNMARWGGVRHGGMEEAMRQIIPLYVEYFLAPGVESIRGVSQELFNNPQRIQVMLGSLGNARNPRLMQWYEELLDYRIKGTYAKSLAGLRVHEIVQAMSIHYLVTAHDDAWSDILDGLASRWIGRGAVRAIWSTEELGVRRAQAGYGAVTALRVTSRYLDWWLQHGWPAEKGHAFFWGAGMGKRGTRADDALRELYQMIGPHALTRLPLKEMAGFESYWFAVGNQRKRVLFVFAREQTGKSEFKSITLPALGWSGAHQAQLRYFTTEGMQTLPLHLTTSGAGTTLSVSSPLPLSIGSALLITYESN